MDIKFNKILYDLPYEVDLQLAQTLGYNLEYKKIIKKQAYLSSTSNHGFARIEGQVVSEGVPLPGTTVSVFNQTTKGIVWTYTTDFEGKYNILNLSPTVKFFIVALDKEEKFNAVIHSSLKAGLDPYVFTRD